MKAIRIYGGHRLHGEITVSGSKNAVLPALAATLLAPGISRIDSVPDLEDVQIMIKLLRSLGCKVKWEGKSVIVDAHCIKSAEAPYDLVKLMRASFLVMGPLLARTGYAKISMPGGCAIGTRPIDLHLKGFSILGVDINKQYGSIEGIANKELTGKTIYLDYPSVGATENIMMLASRISGVTVIENAAKEPEIVDLANMINSMGGHINGAGTSTIRIIGVEEMHPAEHQVIPDRIETGTFIVAAGITGGNIVVKNTIASHLCPVIAKMKEIGTSIKDYGKVIQVMGPVRLKPTDIYTLPYPGFPTDMQPQMMSLLTMAGGTSIITETVFENRFMHVDELCRMGANIKTEGNKAIIKGVDKLYGVNVEASDLRAGAALVLAGLAAEGITTVSGVNHIDRGYEGLEKRLQGIGARIQRTDYLKKRNTVG